MFQELFVDAPADGSSDDDTTDSEESVYSGLGEEEEEESGSEEEVVEEEDSDDEEEDEDEEAASSESESETENGETGTVMTTDTNILRSRQNGLTFCRIHFQMHFPQWKCLNLSEISLKFVLKGAIDNKPA